MSDKFTLKGVSHGHFSTDKREHYKVKNNKMNTLNYHFWDIERQTHIIMSSHHVNMNSINLRCCKKTKKKPTSVPPQQ